MKKEQHKGNAATSSSV